MASRPGRWRPIRLIRERSSSIVGRKPRDRGSSSPAGRRPARRADRRGSKHRRPARDRERLRCGSIRRPPAACDDTRRRAEGTSRLPDPTAPHDVLAHSVATVNVQFRVQIETGTAGRDLGDQFRSALEVVILADPRLPLFPRVDEQNRIGLGLVVQVESRCCCLPSPLRAWLPRTGLANRSAWRADDRGGDNAQAMACGRLLRPAPPFSDRASLRTGVRIPIV